MICFGRAVEFQLRYQTEKRFGRSLKSLWRRLYPRRDNSNLWGFHLQPRLTVHNRSGRFRTRVDRCRGRPGELSKFNEARNQATHGQPQAKHLADRIVGDWLDCTQPDAQGLWSVLTPG